MDPTPLAVAKIIGCFLQMDSEALYREMKPMGRSK